MIELLLWVLGPLVLGGAFIGYRWWKHRPSPPPPSRPHDWSYPPLSRPLPPPPPAPTAPTPPRERDGIDPLLAGVIGYAIGRSEGHKAEQQAEPMPAFEPGGGQFGGAGASAGWETPTADEPVAESSDGGGSSDAGDSSGGSGE